MQVISSLPSPSAREHVRERRLRVPPRDQRLVDEADGLADAEAPLGVVARGGRHRAAAHARERRADRLRVLRRAIASGKYATSAASAVCWLREGTTTTCFSESSAARSAAMITFALFGSTTTSSAGTAWIPASSS